MTDLERAQEIADRAWEETDPCGVRALAEEALAVSELCADAWVLLAGLEDNPAQTVRLNRKALDAAERVLGRGFFEEAAGRFFDHPHGQRYFRARSALAVSLEEAGERGEAISHLWAVVELDPRDPPGVRRFLACWLSVEGRDDELEELLGAFPGDALAHVAYSRALLAHRRGDPSAGAILKVAQEDFPLVVPYLLGERAVPPLPMLTLDAYVRFALESPSRYRLIGQEMSGSPHREVQEAARAVNARFVRAVAACQEAGELPGGDPVELAAILFATTHGAVELTLSGQAEEEKGLGDPAKLVRALLARLRQD